MKRGIALVELLVAMGIMAVMLPALVTVFFASRGGGVQQAARVRAAASIREAKEALRVVRDNDWANLADLTEGDPYHPTLTGNSWGLTAGVETVDPVIGLTRQIELLPAYRDGSGNLNVSAGTLDPSVKRVVITASWALSTMTSDFFLMRFENLIWEQTLAAEFNLGTLVGVAVTNTTGGEVVLGSGGSSGSSWCEPSLSITALDLPKSGKATSVTTVVGEAYAGTGENSAGESFVDINITNTTPPNASVLGVIDGYKTNDIFGESDYGYIATDNNHREVVIIQLASLPYTQVGYFNAPGNDFGESVFVSDNIGYIVVKDKLYNFDLSGKTGARSGLDSNGVTLTKEGTSIYVVGSYAYVSIKGENNVQMDIIDVSNPSSIVRVGTAKVNNQSGVDLVVNSTGTRAYIVTNATSPDEREFHVVNIENKTSPTKIGVGYYTSGMNPEAVEVLTANYALVVGQGGEEYQVLDMVNEAVPTRCGGIQVDAGIFDSASVMEPDGDAYAYIVTGDASSEFKIIQGGAGAGSGAYANDGIFDSQILDADKSSMFNRFETTSSAPVDTTIEYQVAIANPFAGSCDGATFSFVGPDKTSGSTFGPSGGVLPLGLGQGYNNPGQCFRLRAILHTENQNNTPIMYDFTVNYSP